VIGSAARQQVDSPFGKGNYPSSRNVAQVEPELQGVLAVVPPLLTEYASARRGAGRPGGDLSARARPPAVWRFPRRGN